MRPEIIGWTSSVILLVTLAAQTRKLYRTRSNQGVSKWLWIGELAAAIGFMTYSALLRNAVYITTNALGVVTSLLGLAFFLRNRRFENASVTRSGGQRCSES
jgi:MtN3 and saliva related transmembrane protein